MPGGKKQEDKCIHTTIGHNLTLTAANDSSHLLSGIIYLVKGKISTIMHHLIVKNVRKALHSLIKKVQSNPVVTFPDDIITEGRRIPAIASLFVVCLLAQGLFP